MRVKKAMAVAAVAMVLLAGCAVEKYKPVQPAFAGNPSGPGSAPLVVLLTPVFPDKPFAETVCDNTIGAFWSPGESHNIGFTQRYGRTLAHAGPQLAMLASLPATTRVGMTASGEAGEMNIDSRLMVPFGRLITDNLTQALGADGQVCADDQCVQQALRARPGAQLVTVTFTKFRVAEDQRNMLTLEVEGAAVARRGGAAPAMFAIHNKVQKSITSEGHFHSDFLVAMNKIANGSTSAVVEQILAAGR
jgi:hypothetical protein